MIGDINIEGANALVDELCSSGADARAHRYDQADEASINALVETTISACGQLDGLFANVADLQIIYQDGDILTNDIEIWERTLKVNVTGTALLIRAVLPQMLAQGSGSMVLTSSGASTMGEGERPAYAVSKAGINALCRHVASAWGKKNIRCNAVAPGFVITEQIQSNMDQSMLDRMLKQSSSARHGIPADIASAVAFLLSDESEWVNGQTWHVNGGAVFAN